MSDLRELAQNLWVIDRPLGNFMVEPGTRMSVIRLGDRGLFLHSPVRSDPALLAALDAVGPVRFVVAPNKAHHLFVADYLRKYPEARLYGAPGLADKRKDLNFNGGVLGDEPAAEWAGAIEQHLFLGAPFLNEVLFFHRPTRTLISTDLVFNIVPEHVHSFRARLFCLVTGAAGRFGPHRLIRRAISDRAAARRSVERVLRWDFDRVIVTHGEILESGGHEKFRAAFAYL